MSSRSAEFKNRDACWCCCSHSRRRSQLFVLHHQWRRRLRVACQRARTGLNICFLSRASVKAARPPAFLLAGRVAQSLPPTQQLQALVDLAASNPADRNSFRASKIARPRQWLADHRIGSQLLHFDTKIRHDSC